MLPRCCRKRLNPWKHHANKDLLSWDVRWDKREESRRAEDKRRMEDTEISHTTVGVSPGRKQIYRLNRDRCPANEYFLMESPHRDIGGGHKIVQHVQQSLLKEPEGNKWQTYPQWLSLPRKLCVYVYIMLVWVCELPSMKSSLRFSPH